MLQSKNAISDVGAGLHCTALHCTALHCTALHCTVTTQDDIQMDLQAVNSTPKASRDDALTAQFALVPFSALTSSALGSAGALPIRLAH